MSFIIFLSPSEDKNITQHDMSSESLLHHPSQDSSCLESYHIVNPHTSTTFLQSLWQGDIMYHHRNNINAIYKEAVKKILATNDKTLLFEIYGAKNFNAKNEFELNIAYQQRDTMAAIERYCGVAFNGLDFISLSGDSREFILQYVYIFSNLFGVIAAHDNIPFYKLKQNTKYTPLSLMSVYKPFVPILESFLQKYDFVIDLRAGIYTKIFMPKQRRFFFEFQKNGKTISHYAKLYRGKMLNLISKNTQFSNYNFHEALEFFQHINDNKMMFCNSTECANTIILRYEIQE